MISGNSFSGLTWPLYVDLGQNNHFSSTPPIFSFRAVANALLLSFNISPFRVGRAFSLVQCKTSTLWTSSLVQLQNSVACSITHLHSSINSEEDGRKQDTNMKDRG